MCVLCGFHESFRSDQETFKFKISTIDFTKLFLLLYNLIFSSYQLSEIITSFGKIASDICKLFHLLNLVSSFVPFISSHIVNLTSPENPSEMELIATKCILLFTLARRTRTSSCTACTIKRTYSYILVQIFCDTIPQGDLCISLFPSFFFLLFFCYKYLASRARTLQGKVSSRFRRKKKLSCQLLNRKFLK